MIRNTVFTFSVKALTAILNFLIAVITARYLGAEGRGVIGIFVLNVSLVFMVGSLVGGAGLVYLAPREDTGRLMGASMIWAGIACLAVPALMHLLGLAGQGLALHLGIISMLHFSIRIHQNWLLAREKITAFNVISLVHPLLMSMLLIFFFTVLKWREVMAFIAAYYITTIIGLLASSGYMHAHGGLRFSFRIRRTAASAFRMGGPIQAGNLMQLMNYRFSFYLLQVFYGKAQVGLYSMATAFTESSWMIANSFATVQYARISNSGDDAANQALTVAVMRWSLWLTLVPLVVLLVLPPEFYSFFLSGEFTVLPDIIPWLMPGMLCVVISIAISHYFSGSGNPKVGMIGSAAGFITTLVAGFLLVPAYGLTGAAATASLSYAVSAIVGLYLFSKKRKLRPVDFILRRADLSLLKEPGGSR